MFETIEVVFESKDIIPPDPGGCACCLCIKATSAYYAQAHTTNIQLG